ncbi:MAG: TldD/PmbA family protein [Lachnospiraceae bacterium]|nr:TldD/PmbA family protein [Lachnospiraceae bacterium]MCM1239157.1 TldD/PmbA family protein [Lachnospiraceae bacterium]
MKVKSSEYLSGIKPVLCRLRDWLLEEYPYVSILAADSAAKQYSVSKTVTSVSMVGRLSGRGFVVKVYDGSSYGEYSFNEISEDKIEDIVNKIKEELMPMSEGLPEGVKRSVYAMLEDDPLVFADGTEYKIDPEEYGDEAIIRELTQISETGRAYSDKILDCRAFANYQKYSKLFLSKNRDMEQNVLWMTGGYSVMASRGEEIKDSHRGFSCLGGAEFLEKLQDGVKDAAHVALELLESEPITPGEYDCICEPAVTGMIVHEAFGHGVEMDMFVKKRALAEQFVGSQVASESVTMHDGAAAAKEVATYFFDDEGVLAKDTVVIDHGILKSGISDAQSAMHLGTVPTGNGRRESYQRKAYTRMTNTFFEGGKDKLEDMIASISYGFLLEEASSGMEDPKNWGIQCMVSIAREIRDGKLTGKIYSPVVLTGYVPDLLKSVSMVSEEVRLCGTGFCGKGYKEWVKVSDGGPYIKAKIRLG